ncbi:MAG: drug/metabolite transporter (DMT)-like permease [Alteromonadaceae bacterium]|jgi:drug/metabolite transporter (DMT)-like permease
MKKFIPFLFVLLWSTGFIGTKYGLMYSSSGDFLTLRTLANLIIFALLVLMIKRNKLSGRQIFHAMVTGLLIHGVYLGGVYSAIELELPAGLTAIIVGVQPLLTALIAVFVLNERMTPIQWGALLLGLAGLFMVVSGGLHVQNISYQAIFFAIFALFGITIGTIYQKRFCQNQPLLPSVFWQYFACLFVFITLSYWQQPSNIEWHIEFLLSLTWLVFALSVAAILLLLYMIKQGDAAKVSTYFYLVPPMTAIEAWYLFDESLSLIMLVGMFLCAISVFIVVKHKNKVQAVKV